MTTWLNIQIECYILTEFSTVFEFFHGTADWDEANKVKVLLEEKQRAARRRREQEAADAAAQGL